MTMKELKNGAQENGKLKKRALKNIKNFMMRQ